MLCCALFICNGNAAWDYLTLTVDVNAELVYNNHVGDDWYNSYCVIYNGKTYSCASGESMTILYHPDAQLQIYTYICEADDASSDVGSYSDYHSFSVDDICDGNRYGWMHSVYVTENGGRYKWNTAQWDVTYTFYVKPSPTPRPTARPTAKPYVLPERVIPTTEPTRATFHPTNTPELTTEPVETPEPESKSENSISDAWVVVFIVAAWLFSMGSYVFSEIEEKGKRSNR